MALISCPSCGKQLSDKATACPHCGAARTATQTPTPSPAAQKPKGSGKKIAIGIAAVAAVALIVASVVLVGSSGKKPKDTIRDDSTGPAVSEQSAEPSDTPAAAIVDPASPAADFEIENGTLVKYVGPGGDVVIPSSVTKLGKEAFYGCTSLTSVVIPDSVTDLGGAAFQKCSNLKSVTIPDSVTEIGLLTFSECTSLTGVTIPSSVTSIDSWAFGSSGLKSITIPGSVTAMGDEVFGFCTDLTNVTIADGVTTIGAMAFEGCDSLADVTIPASVTQIGEFAFSNSGLKSVTILGGATDIGEYAFYPCPDLVAIYGVAGSAAEQYARENGIPFGSDGPGSEVRLYNIEINVECIENIRKNKYDVDILVDGEQIDTLKHGQSTQIHGPLPEGSHKVEFRLNEQTTDVNSSYDESSITSVTKTIHLSQNETFSFSIKMTWEGITVS